MFNRDDWLAMGEQLPRPINAAPQHHYVMHTALDALNRGAANGKAPPKGAPLEISTGESPSFVVDMHGNAKGGVRSPWVDVPTAKLSALTK